MFAILRSGGKQYKVKAGDRIEIEKLEGKQGDKVELGDVLLTSNGAASGVKVIAEVLKQFRDEKVVIFKKRRRHNYRRKKGHRQYLTQVEIKEIKA